MTTAQDRPRHVLRRVFVVAAAAAGLAGLATLSIATLLDRPSGEPVVPRAPHLALSESAWSITENFAADLATDRRVASVEGVTVTIGEQRGGLGTSYLGRFTVVADEDLEWETELERLVPHIQTTISRIRASNAWLRLLVVVRQGPWQLELGGDWSRISELSSLLADAKNDPEVLGAEIYTNGAPLGTRDPKVHGVAVWLTVKPEADLERLAEGWADRARVVVRTPVASTGLLLRSDEILDE